MMVVAAAPGTLGPAVAAADDDVTLVARAAAGDQAAFATIYQQLVDGVHARLTRLLGPTADRDDVLQQTFIALHGALGRFRGQASLATFVHRIAVNAAIDHLRARARQPAPLADAALDRLIAPAPSPAARLQRRRRRRSPTPRG